MNRFRTLLPISLVLLASCSTTTSIRLLPEKETASIETLYKNQTVGKGSSFDLEVSDLITEDRTLTFIKDGRPIGKKDLQRTVTIPMLFAAIFIAPIFYSAPVKKQQTFDLSDQLKNSQATTP